MAVSTEDIKNLREKTGAGIMDCRAALTETGNDMEAALVFLREKGLEAAAKRADRVASEGVVELYSHGGGRVGVMVELNCETDFVGRSEEFLKLAHEIALQIAASAPEFISEDDIPAEVLKQEEQDVTARVKEEGKPDNIIPKIVEGYIKKFKDQAVLLNQAYIRDDSRTIQDLINEKVAALGENIIIRRFSRYELGEASGSDSEETEE